MIIFLGSNCFKKLVKIISLRGHRVSAMSPQFFSSTEPDRLPEDPGVCPGLREVERSWRVESVSVKSKKPTDKLRARLKQDDVITSRLGFKPWQLRSVQSGVHQTAIWAWLSKAIGNLCIFCVYVASFFFLFLNVSVEYLICSSVCLLIFSPKIWICLRCF